jgi:hypothetical protein
VDGDEDDKGNWLSMIGSSVVMKREAQTNDVACVRIAEGPTIDCCRGGGVYGRWMSRRRSVRCVDVTRVRNVMSEPVSTLFLVIVFSCGGSLFPCYITVAYGY